MSIDWDRVGPRLKGLRKNKRWTQVELADRLGVAWNTVLRLETGNRRPSLDMLERLADTLGCSVADLLPETKTSGRTKTRGRR